ncbi:MAG: diadenylate cyclase CdaA [Deltaproteobacteria bacterium]|nr:diadenylate cyclase CdaA [Deltaproteobacteria bacterium]
MQLPEFIPWFTNVFDLVDIFLAAFVLYWVMLFLKGTRAERMLWGIAVLIIVYFVSGRLELFTLNWILSNILGSMVLIIIVVFQQDIRRALVQMGRPFASRDMAGLTEFLDEVSRAVVTMSNTSTGCIIAIERSVDLKDVLDTGVTIDGNVTRDLLLTIFNTASPMHDGAVVISRGRIAKAGCILPLTEKELTKGMGTRHRAAIGLSEDTDAVVIVVSERTGEVSLVVEERLEMGIEPAALLDRLNKVITTQGTPKSGFLGWRRSR